MTGAVICQGCVGGIFVARAVGRFTGGRFLPGRSSEGENLKLGELNLRGVRG